MIELRIMARNIWTTAVMSVLSAILSGCLVVQSEAPSTSPRQFFAGATSAVNLGGAIRVNWSAPSEPITKYKIYLVESNGDLKYLDTVDASKTSYTHTSGLEKSKTYSYIVRATDAAGVEDTNRVIVTSFIFSGIVSVNITGRTTANVSLPGDAGAFDRIRIYALANGTTVRKLLKEVDRGTYSVDVTGLRPGITYNFSAIAYNSSLAQEDGNKLSLPGRTLSHSFDGSDYRYRGVMSVMAFGEAPNAPYDATDPKRVPKDRLVRLTYLPFAGATRATQYKIVRTLKGSKIDMSTTTECTSSTDTSCWVCDNWAGPNTCDDVNVAAPPKRYDYAISQYFTDGTDTWVEELPPTNSEFRVSVAIPPQNMVLVNRDAANYEMCDILGQPSDPKNNQRCPYTGIGATPYNSGPERPTPLNLAYGYYDFGYNLFVDRWELACNWTRAADGGKCGAGGTDGDCFRYNDPPSAAPPASIGVNGNILYQIGGMNGGGDWSLCYVKNAGTWTRVDLINSWGAATIATLKPATSDPGPIKQRGPIERLFGPWSSNNPTNLCASMTTEYNIPKRMMRMREWRTAAAWPRFSKEPYSMSQTTANDLEVGTLTTPGACLSQYIWTGNVNTSTLIGKIASPNFAALLGSSSEFLIYKDGSNNVYGRTRVGIGSSWSSRCLSRYGAQDMIGNTDEVVSDAVSCGADNNCVYLGTSTDPGNKDLQGVKFDGATVWMPHTPGAAAYTINAWFPWGHTLIHGLTRLTNFNVNMTGKTPIPSAGPGPSYLPVPFINPTLGLPLMQNDYGNAIPISSFKFNATNDALFDWRSDSSSRNGGFSLGGYQQEGGSGRWNTSYDWGGGQHTTRCAQSAE